MIAFEIVLPWLALAFGLLIGSFLNVCIVRIPKGESVVTPRSHCPRCNHMITWYENIPVLSYLFLRGKCSGCGLPISALYPTIEAITGLLFWSLAMWFGAQLVLVKYLVFAALMVALAVIDLRERLLPDELTFPGLLFGIGFSLFIPVQDGTAFFLTRHLGAWPIQMVSALDALIGAAIGAGVIWSVGMAYYLWRKVEGMGFGDVTLMGVIGAFLGLKLAMLTIFLGCMAGSVIGVIFIYAAQGGDTKYELPFGSFLAPCALFSVFWGREILHWYGSQLSF